jgi:hypothetical protein|tara:strand:+ start:583 stop:804 length:222 start_codon:yes stop_codon:yes gene_type:complete
LFFLSIAAKRKYVVDSYIDNADGIMEKDEQGKMAMTKVTARPYLLFSSDKELILLQLEKCTIKHMNCVLSPTQ